MIRVCIMSGSSSCLRCSRGRHHVCVAGPGQCSNLCRRESSRRSLTWLESDDGQADEHFQESSAVATVDWRIVLRLTLALACDSEW